jgi:hypothetical protein
MIEEGNNIMSPTALLFFSDYLIDGVFIQPVTHRSRKEKKVALCRFYRIEKT